jgi:hypothetical protein
MFISDGREHARSSRRASSNRENISATSVGAIPVLESSCLGVTAKAAQALGLAGQVAIACLRRTRSAPKIDCVEIRMRFAAEISH